MESGCCGFMFASFTRLLNNGRISLLGGERTRQMWKTSNHLFNCSLVPLIIRSLRYVEGGLDFLPGKRRLIVPAYLKLKHTLLHFCLRAVISLQCPLPNHQQLPDNSTSLVDRYIGGLKMNLRVGARHRQQLLWPRAHRQGVRGRHSGPSRCCLFLCSCSPCFPGGCLCS